VKVPPAVIEMLAYVLLAAAATEVVVCGVIVWQAIGGPLGIVAGAAAALASAELLRRPVGRALHRLIAAL
jgi:hypothetical protein